MSTRSTSVVSSASNAATSIMDTITTTTTVITQSVDAVGALASTAHRYARDLDQDHADRSKVHRATYRAKMIEKMSFEIAQRRENIAKQLNSNPQLLDEFNSVKSELASLFTEDQPKG